MDIHEILEAINTEPEPPSPWKSLGILGAMLLAIKIIFSPFQFMQRTIVMTREYTASHLYNTWRDSMDEEMSKEDSCKSPNTESKT